MRGPQPVALQTGAGISVLVAMALCGLTSVGPTEGREVGADTRACEGLIGHYSEIPDAPTDVIAASVSASDASLPEYCRVEAKIAPQIAIELRLPTAAWNGKFLEIARGGYCRKITMEQCDQPLRQGYACIITDHGHKDTSQDDIWMHDNLQAAVDCGYRATHLAAVVGKHLTETFYGRSQHRAYLMGCSTGGRLAMVEAQRFPDDFDGIVAGAPPYQKTKDALALMWNVNAFLSPDGEARLSPSDLELLHKAVLAKCDADDGLRDGILAAPLSCAFDPRTLLCSRTRSHACLSAGQVEAIMKVYQGPQNERGSRIANATALPGSELNWIGSFLKRGHEPSPVQVSMTNLFRYLNTPERGPRWRTLDFDWEREPKRIFLMESITNAANPDLRPFKAAGGKLIVYHGLNDEFIGPRNSIDYYESVERLMGGPADTADFFRMFLIPGMNHCGGGIGPNQIDYLGALDAWLERSQAAEVMIARSAAIKPAQSGIARTRPIYAYPLRAQYRGSGSPDDPASYSPVSIAVQ